MVRIDGVLDLRSDEWDRMQSFRLLCPVDTNLSVIRPAPWWTSDHTIYVGSGLTALVVFALLWAITLQSRVSRQTETIEEEAAARNEIADRYNTLVEQAGELIFSTTRSGVFISVNPSTERVFDAPNNQLISENISKYLCEDTATHLQHILAELSEDKPHAVCELKTTSGIVLELAARLDSSKHDQEVQCIARDVSERQKLEQQIRRMQTMESVGQLAAGIAHDFNNLLAVISMNCDLLLHVSDLPKNNVGSVDLIQDATNRAAKLTNQLLAFSRRQTINATEFQTNEFLQQMTEMLQQLLGEKITLTTSLSEVPDLNADSDMLHQVILNLVLNARDAMSDGGNIDISSSAVNIDTELAARNIDAIPGEYVKISVKDDGCGMEPEVLSSIFEPFFTTKDTGKGTGLGLSTAFGIVKQHEGWIDVESTPGQGSIFSVYLPLSPSQAQESCDSSEVTAKASFETGQPEAILVVDDDSSVRLTVTNILERAGYHVIQSVNGNEALEIWDRRHDSIRLVITDMVMPGGKTGADVGREIKASAPDMPIIYSTGYSSEMKNAALSTNERLLPKPFERASLIRMVHELLNTPANAA